MSATFDSDMFAQYFALPVRDQLEPAPIVSVEGKPFKVTEYYAEDLQQLGEVKEKQDLLEIYFFFSSRKLMFLSKKTRHCDF